MKNNGFQNIGHQVIKSSDPCGTRNKQDSLTWPV